MTTKQPKWQKARIKNWWLRFTPYWRGYYLGITVAASIDAFLHGVLGTGLVFLMLALLMVSVDQQEGAKKDEECQWYFG